MYVDQGRIKKGVATENDNSNTEKVEPKMIADAVEVDQGADGARTVTVTVKLGIWMRYLVRLIDTKLLNWNTNFKGK